MEIFRAAQASGADWHAACRACLCQLTDLPPGARLGFVYASGSLADALDLIVARLTAATGVDDWVGAGGAGVCANGREYWEQGAIVVMVTDLAVDDYRLFDGMQRALAGLDGAMGARSGGARAAFGIVHADARQPEVPSMVERFGERTGAFLVGGLSSAQPSTAQIAGRPTEGGLSGVLISDAVPMITALSQACTPIGPAHEVTATQGAWITALDGRPALEVLTEEIGEVLARNLDRLAGFIHAAVPVAGSDQADYLVRNLLGAAPAHGMIAVAGELRRGDRILFVKRDAASARADLEDMLTTLRRRAAGRPIVGALYHSCIARGPRLFGTDSGELKTIERALGPVPLAGCFTDGEIFHGRLYGYTGVLTLFLSDAPSGALA